jgi:hypothetical protein
VSRETPVREYLYIEQIAAVTPWSPSAIETMVRRGVLQRGKHYFQPQGPRGRLIFRWSAMVEWIEHHAQIPSVLKGSNCASPPVSGMAIRDVEAATKALQRLLD